MLAAVTPSTKLVYDAIQIVLPPRYRDGNYHAAVLLSKTRAGRQRRNQSRNAYNVQNLND